MEQRFLGYLEKLKNKPAAFLFFSFFMAKNLYSCYFTVLLGVICMDKIRVIQMIRSNILECSDTKRAYAEEIARRWSRL